MGQLITTDPNTLKLTEVSAYTNLRCLLDVVVAASAALVPGAAKEKRLHLFGLHHSGTRVCLLGGAAATAAAAFFGITPPFATARGARRGRGLLRRHALPTCCLVFLRPMGTHVHFYGARTILDADLGQPGI